jgi:hypothetical protein
MPQPEFPLAKRPGAPPWVAPAETIPDEEAEGYRAYVNFGGLFLTVDAPCGCKMHYDTTALLEQAHNSNCLEVCCRANCDFDYAKAEAAAIEALKDFVTHGPDYDLGGEGG